MRYMRAADVLPPDLLDRFLPHVGHAPTFVTL